MERSATADIAKTIGIILVVIGHYNPADAPEWYHLANRFIYAFHMPLFMFASGYIYAMTGHSQNKGGGHFILKYFMLGVFLINWPRWLDSAKKIPGMIPVCALPVLFACTLLVRNDILTGLMGYILPFAGIHTICVISARIKSLKHITQKLLVVSASSYIIYLFHTTFEGFVKSLVQQVPLLANGNDPLYFSVGAAAVIGAGIFLPIILHRYILQRNRLLRFLFGLKPAK